MSKFILSIIIVTLSAGASSQPCSCQKALEDDLPYGANEDIEYRERTVKKVQGHILYRYDGEAADDIVVEIYDISEADKNFSSSKIALYRDRRAACVTTKDGSFCFPDLPSGRYVIRAGSRNSSAGMNEAYMKVTVDRRWWANWFRSRKKIELELTVGT